MICKTGAVIADDIKGILNALKNQSSGMNRATYSKLMDLIEKHKSSEEHGLDSDCELEDVEGWLYEMHNYSAADNSKMSRDKLIETDEEYNKLASKLFAARRELIELQNPPFFEYLFTSSETRTEKVNAKQRDILELEDKMMRRGISVVNNKDNKSKLSDMNNSNLAITPNAIEYVLSK